MANPSPGLTWPIGQPERRTTTSTSISHNQSYPPRDGNEQINSTRYSQLHLAPATRTITTTTTETIHFSPILVPQSNRVSSQHGPRAFANFMQNDSETSLQLDPKLYPLSQRPWPVALGKFKLKVGDFDAVFVEGGEPAIDDSAQGHLDKGKGKSAPASASRMARGAHVQRKKSRRSRGGIASLQDHGLEMPAQGTMDLTGDDAGTSTAGFARLPSPGPPRKRPRGETHRSHSRSSSVDSDTLIFRTDGTTYTSAAFGSHTFGTLPSPNLSPPSPIASWSAEDDEQDIGDFADPPILKEQPPGDDIPADRVSTMGEQAYDFGSGQPLSGLLSLPDFVNTFDQLTPALQSYFIFTFLKRSSIPVLQTINNLIAPSLRRDFLTDLPPELGVHILGYLDVKALCRATVVCARWRRLVDGEWRVWKERLTEDDLWIGDGSETREAKEIIEGSKETRFLQRWKAGVWDDATAARRPLRSFEGKRDPDEMHIDGDRIDFRRLSRTANLASPSSSREPSVAPTGHYVHPFKALYRRRYVTRRNWAEREPERVSFACHGTSVVTCLQFDKEKIVSASDDHSINVFDTRTGETRADLRGHEGGVWALQYIGNILVSGSTDRTVRVWDLEKGVCTHVFVGHTSTVRCLQIVEPENIQTDPRGPPIWEPPFPLIVTGSRDWSLRVWKLPSPERDDQYHPVVPMSPTEENTDPSDNPFHLRHLAGHRHAVRALAAHGKNLVSGSYDCTVRVWDMLTGECKHRLAGHTQKVYSVVYDHQRKQCASGSMDSTVRLWSTETGECRATLEGHTSLVGLLGLSQRTVVSAAADSTLRIWDPRTGECRHTLTAHSGAITCFQHDEYKVISGSDGTLKMWDVQTGKFARDLLTDLTGVWQVSFDNRFCVAAVQRNGRSEFEILDFGPVDEESEQEEARLTEVREEAQVREIVETTVMEEDDLSTHRAGVSPNRTPHRAIARVASHRSIALAASTFPSTSTPAAPISAYQGRINAASQLQDPFAATPVASTVAVVTEEVEQDVSEPVASLGL